MEIKKYCLLANGKILPARYQNGQPKKGFSEFYHKTWYEYEYENPKTYEIQFHKDEVLRFGDTIEELCDLAVIKKNDGYTLSKKWNWAILQKQLKVYGAVWTDKGLEFIVQLIGVHDGSPIWEVLK